jgi:hypothetical protein
MNDVASVDTCIQCYSQGRPGAGLIDGTAYIHNPRFTRSQIGIMRLVALPYSGPTSAAAAAENSAHKMTVTNAVVSVLIRN